MDIVSILVLCPLLFSVLTASAFAQTPASGPTDSSKVMPGFQVATIKPSQPQESRTMQIRGNRFATTDTSVSDLLKYAYGLHEQEIVGGPSWLETQKFDLMCDPETEARPSTDDFKKMVQALLSDRFRLVAHREIRDLSVLEIVNARTGPRLTKSDMPPNGLPTYGYAPGQLSVRNATMADFATYLQRFVTDRPVFDRTGAAGKYDLDLRWTPDDSQIEESRQGDERNTSFPGLYTAIQEQLGLKLQEAKRPAPVLVIDQVELPSPN